MEAGKLCEEGGDVGEGLGAVGFTVFAREENVAGFGVENVFEREAEGEGGLLVCENVLLCGDHEGGGERLELLQRRGEVAVFVFGAVGIVEVVHEARREGPGFGIGFPGTEVSGREEGGNGVDEEELVRLCGGECAEGEVTACGVAT